MKHGSVLLAINAGQNVPMTIQLLPPGPIVTGTDGRTWSLTDPEAVVNATNEIGRALPIDENHATDLKPPGEPAPAIGWIETVHMRDDGSIWGHVVWTERGKELIASRGYRYISPVFNYDKASRAIRDIQGAGLVNRPNLRLAALNNQTSDEEEDEMTIPASIVAAVGLASDADEHQVIQAINALKSSQGTATNAVTTGVDLTKYAPRADYDLMEQRAINAEKRVKSLETDDLSRRATAAVESAITARKIAPASKDAYLAMCSTEEGLGQFGDIVKTTPEIISADTETPEGNPGTDGTALNAAEKEVARQLGIPESDEAAEK